MGFRPYGPRKVAPKQQISVPTALLDAIGVEVGDEVWLALNPDKPGTLVLLPERLAELVFEKGWTAI